MLKRNSLASHLVGEKRKFLGPLNIRTPEDQFVSDHNLNYDPETASASFRKAMLDWRNALKEGDLHAVIEAGRNLRQENDKHYSMSGVPPHAHNLMPWRSIRDYFESKASPPTRDDVDHLVALFEPSSRPLIEQQVGRLLDEVNLGKQPALRLGSEADPGYGGFDLPPHDQPAAKAPFEELRYRTPSLLASNDVVPRAAREGNVLGDSVPLASKQRTPEERAEELDKRDPIAAAAHPAAWALDETLNELFGEGGAFGDWGKRSVVPAPEDDMSRKAGELIRLYLQIGAPLGGTVKAARFGNAIRTSLEKRSVKAVLGGALSVIAEWRANSHKAPRDQPTGWDYALAFVSGAVTGGIEPKWGKAGFDGAVAFLSSLLGDIGSGRSVSMPGALSAGFAAWFVTRAGGLVKLQEARLASQFFAKYGKKYLEKEVKQFFEAVLGDDLVFTPQEWRQFWNGFEDHWRRQWEEFVQQGDANPLF